MLYRPDSREGSTATACHIRHPFARNRNGGKRVARIKSRQLSPLVANRRWATAKATRRRDAQIDNLVRSLSGKDYLNCPNRRAPSLRAYFFLPQRQSVSLDVDNNFQWYRFGRSIFHRRDLHRAVPNKGHLCTEQKRHKSRDWD